MSLRHRKQIGPVGSIVIPPRSPQRTHGRGV